MNKMLVSPKLQKVLNERGKGLRKLNNAHNPKNLTWKVKY